MINQTPLYISQNLLFIHIYIKSWTPEISDFTLGIHYYQLDYIHNLASNSGLYKIQPTCDEMYNTYYILISMYMLSTISIIFTWMLLTRVACHNVVVQKQVKYIYFQQFNISYLNIFFFYKIKIKHTQTRNKSLTNL